MLLAVGSFGLLQEALHVSFARCGGGGHGDGGLHDALLDVVGLVPVGGVEGGVVGVEASHSDLVFEIAVAHFAEVGEAHLLDGELGVVAALLAVAGEDDADVGAVVEVDGAADVGE